MPSTLLQKLQLRPGQRLTLRNAPPRLPEALAAGLAGRASVEAVAGEAVLLFVTALAEVERLAPDAIAAAGHDGLLWLAYPKGGSGVPTDVNRDKLWQAMAPTGWRPVRQIALDDVWSAMRFRPGTLVEP